MGAYNSVMSAFYKVTSDLSIIVVDQLRGLINCATHREIRVASDGQCRAITVGNRPAGRGALKGEFSGLKYFSMQ